MRYLKFVCLALFAAAVTLKLLYIIVKTVRITVLKVDPPMAGFDSEPEPEDSIRDAAEVHEVVVKHAAVEEKPVPGLETGADALN